MPRYIQIDKKTGHIISDSFLAAAVDAPDMIPVSDDFEAGNIKYVDGKWEEYIPEEIVPEPTQLDIIEENQLIIMEALASQYESSIE